MRTLALSVCAIFLGACPQKPPVERTTTPPVQALPDPAEPEGWWIETADEINAGDVGNGARFAAEGAIIVTKSGGVERPVARLTRVAPREWRFRIDKDDGTLRQPAADTLVIEIRGKRITFRRATDAESRSFEARTKAPS